MNFPEFKKNLKQLAGNCYRGQSTEIYDFYWGTVQVTYPRWNRLMFGCQPIPKFVVTHYDKVVSDGTWDYETAICWLAAITRINMQNDR
jgi:hypothetical protein